MKKQDFLKLIILIFLMFIIADVYARAGGGGGHGGGIGGAGGVHSGGGHGSGFHHYPGNNYGQNNTWSLIIFIGFIVFGVFTGITTTLLLWKSNFSRKILNRITATDSFWNFEDMRYNARRIFYNMQDAWEKRDIDRVKDSIAPDLYDRYKTLLEEMIQRKEINCISNIDIQETKIIGCEDYKDDSKDRYIAYIKGTMLDYTYNELTGEILKNLDKTPEKFSDTYHFVRFNGNWILENIDNNVSIVDIITARNFKE